MQDKVYKPFIEFEDLPIIKLKDGKTLPLRNIKLKLKKSKRVSPFNRQRI